MTEQIHAVATTSDTKPDDYSLNDWIILNYIERKEMNEEHKETYYHVALDFLRENHEIMHLGNWSKYIGIGRSTLSGTIHKLNQSDGKLIEIPEPAREEFIKLCNQFGSGQSMNFYRLPVTDNIKKGAIEYIGARKHLLHLAKIGRETGIPISTDHLQKYVFTHKY